MINTKIIRFTKNYTSKEIKQSADILLQDKILIHPTENLYGFGASISSLKAIEEIIKLKKRPSQQGFIVLISNYSQLNRLAVISSNLERKLIQKFWPGPLTVIFTTNPNLHNKYITINNTIAIRMVGNEITRKIIELMGIPIISTSLNISGETPINSTEEIIRQFSGKVDGIVIDTTHTFQNIASTIVQVKEDKLCILRRGTIDNYRKKL